MTITPPPSAPPPASPEQRERLRIAERVRGMRILRFQAGADPLEEVNDILQTLADDIGNKLGGLR